MIKNALMLTELLNSLPLSKWGVSKTTGEFAARYGSAISLVQAYQYNIDNYSPFDFHDFLKGRVQTALQNSVHAIAGFLEEKHIPYYIISNSRRDPKLLLGEYSQKQAAVRANIGWIGKNALLVTNEFGSRVRLSTLLVDIDLPPTPPKYQQECKDCQVCVQCCPSQCLKGTNWTTGMEREALIDLSLCRDSAEGIKNCICGLCLLTCPVGRDETHLQKNVVRY